MRIADFEGSLGSIREARAQLFWVGGRFLGDEKDTFDGCWFGGVLDVGGDGC